MLTTNNARERAAEIAYQTLLEIRTLIGEIVPDMSATMVVTGFTQGIVEAGTRLDREIKGLPPEPGVASSEILWALAMGMGAIVAQAEDPAARAELIGQIGVGVVRGMNQATADFEAKKRMN